MLSLTLTQSMRMNPLTKKTNVSFWREPLNSKNHQEIKRGNPKNQRNLKMSRLY